MNIYKYPLEITNFQIVSMPRRAKILSVQEQHSRLNIWALVDPKEELEPRVIEIYGTGHEVNQSGTLQFLGTVQEALGALVWHIFERR
jgi:hypothetical protein